MSHPSSGTAVHESVGPSGVAHPFLTQGPSATYQTCASAGGYATGVLLSSGPTAHWWTAYVGIGLNGNDNTQYVTFSFALSDYNSGSVDGNWGVDTMNWITQATPET